MDQIGSLAGYVVLRLLERPLRPASELHGVLDDQGDRPADGHARVEPSAAATPGRSFGFMLHGRLRREATGAASVRCLNEVFPTSVRAAALGIIYNVSRGVQFLAPVVIAWVAARSTFGAGIALAAPFALLAGLAVWALPETKGVRLVEARDGTQVRLIGSARPALAGPQEVL